MKLCKILLTTFILLLTSNVILANDDETEDRVELQTSYIKGNKELPQILYIVPWQEKKQQAPPTKDITLHSLFGDIYKPVLYNMAQPNVKSE